MTFAQLCNHFKPTTLAAIVVDLGDEPCTPEAKEAQQVAMAALSANVGEHDAAKLIEKEMQS